MLGMVEKVARAICRSMLQDPDIDYEVHHQDGLMKGWKMYESEARAAIEAMQVMWQPIDTAPKDGTKFIGFDGRDMETTKWESLSLMSRGVETGKYVPLYGFVAKYSQWYPTHWQPLPPNPEAE